MPFVNMPTAVLNLPAPDWGRFALQANEFIQRGGEQRAQSGKDMIAHLDKSFEQISKIMQMQSPEYKAARKLQLLKLKYQSDLYDAYSNDPSKFINTANGPVHKDSYEGLKFRRGMVQQSLAIRHLYNSVKKQEAQPDDPRTPYEKAAGLPPIKSTSSTDPNNIDPYDNEETRDELNPEAPSGISVPSSEQLPDTTTAPEGVG